MKTFISTPQGDVLSRSSYRAFWGLPKPKRISSLPCPWRFVSSVACKSNYLRTSDLSNKDELATVNQRFDLKLSEDFRFEQWRRTCHGKPEVWGQHRWWWTLCIELQSRTDSKAHRMKIQQEWHLTVNSDGQISENLSAKSQIFRCKSLCQITPENYSSF